jgi:glucosylceramidase
MVAAAKNPDNSVAVVVFNEGMEQKYFELKTSTSTTQISISPQAIQTILITN